MTYNVVQRIGNNYYLYSVEGKWDPEKKNSKQKRRYIGPCDKDGNPIPSKRAKRVDPVTTDTEQKRIPFSLTSPLHPEIGEVCSFDS